MKTGHVYLSKYFLRFILGRSGCTGISLLLIISCSNLESKGQILWTTPTGQAWLTGINWTGGVVPNTTDIAQFATTPTSGVTGVGINMNMTTNNGANNQAVGAIEVTPARTVGMLIGNSSTSASGTLTLNGATVNAVNNVILRNGSSFHFLLEDYQGFNASQTLTVALNNNTDNIVSIDGTGNITISSVISGASKKLTLSGSGNATLFLTAANLYTGLTTVSSNTLRLNKTGGGTLPATNDVLISGTGTLKISSNQTIKDLTMSGGMLVIDAGVTLTITGAYTVTGGAISNSGTIKLNGGAVAFPGTGVTINNGVAGTMTSLEIASTGDITQTAPFTIDNELKLTSGILISGSTNHVTLNAGTIVTGASNASFVDGPISKIGNSLFTFPVGKMNCGPAGTIKGLAALEISNFTGSSPTDKFTAEYKRGTAYALGTISAPGLHHISACDYWTLTRDNGTAKVDIRLAWDELINNCVFTTPYINFLSSLTIAHNDNLGGNWDAYGINGLTTGNAAAGTVYWAGIQSTSFGAFAIGSIDFFNPLPISINYFTGTKQNGDHLLNWKITCNSTPAVDMLLERSTNAVNYTALHTEFATALRCLQPFYFTDNQPAPGVNYYRLKMIDANGKVSYSSIISLINAVKGIELMRISPNPVVNRKFDLEISTAQNVVFNMLITDLQGRLVQTRSFSLVAGFNTIPVYVPNLAAGTYYVFGNTPEGRTKLLRIVLQ